MQVQTTLLDAIVKFGEDLTVSMLENGTLRLTGNFRGHEREVVIAYAEAN